MKGNPHIKYNCVTKWKPQYVMCIINFNVINR